MSGFRYILFIAWIAFTCNSQALAQDNELPWTDEVLYVADTTDLFIRRQEAILNQARVDLAAAGWRRLLPSVRLGLTFSSRSLLFSPVADDSNASLLQPAGNWTLSFSLPINNLFDSIPLQRALTAVQIAEVNRDLAVQQRMQAMREMKRLQSLVLLEAKHLTLLLDMLGEKHVIEQGLLKLAELKYEQGELSFEGLAAAKLRILELDRQIAVAKYNLKASELAIGRTP